MQFQTDNTPKWEILCIYINSANSITFIFKTLNEIIIDISWLSLFKFKENFIQTVLSFYYRFVLRSLQGSLFPSEVAQTVYLHKKCPSSIASTVSVTWSRDSSNESSVDLGINSDIRNNTSGEGQCSPSRYSPEEHYRRINSDYTLQINSEYTL